MVDISFNYVDTIFQQLSLSNLGTVVVYSWFMVMAIYFGMCRRRPRCFVDIGPKTNLVWPANLEFTSVN